MGWFNKDDFLGDGVRRGSWVEAAIILDRASLRLRSFWAFFKKIIFQLPKNYSTVILDAHEFTQLRKILLTNLLNQTQTVHKNYVN